MNEELKIGFEVEVVNSSPDPPSKTNTTSKRKTEEKKTFKSNKKRKVLEGMKAVELQKILQTEPIKFCQDMGLMAKKVKCVCSHDMVLNKCEGRKGNFEWRCRKNGNGHHQSVRRGTWFEKSKLTPVEILWIAYMWVHEYSLKSMLHESNFGEKAVREWCGSCLDLCQAILEQKCNPLGGENKTVEILQCPFKQEKAKKEKWIFCAFEQDSTNSLMIFVEDKSSESVGQIFKKYFLPGTTVTGRVWSFYQNLSEGDFESLIKDKSLIFFDLVTKVKMDTFKVFEKTTRHQRPGLCKLVYDEEFFEKMYRKSLAFAPDAYLTFLKDVSTIYKPFDTVVKPIKVDKISNADEN